MRLRDDTERLLCSWNLLTDRTSPMLRSYLWAYPAGVDWFVRLAEDSSTQDQQRVFRAAYRDPLTSQDLRRYWRRMRQPPILNQIDRS